MKTFGENSEDKYSENLFCFQNSDEFVEKRGEEVEQIKGAESPG